MATNCASICDCGAPGGIPHEPDCHVHQQCADGLWCDVHYAEAVADHAYLKGTDPRFVFGADAQPASEFEYNQELRAAGRGHLVRE